MPSVFVKLDALTKSQRGKRVRSLKKVGGEKKG